MYTAVFVSIFGAHLGDYSLSYKSARDARVRAAQTMNMYGIR